jgi:hypothetical protein
MTYVVDNGEAIEDNQNDEDALGSRSGLCI